MRKRSKICCGEEMEPMWYISIYRHLPNGPKDIPYYRCKKCRKEIERFDELHPLNGYTAEILNTT